MHIILHSWGKIVKLKYFNTVLVIGAFVTRWPRLQVLSVIDVFCLALADIAQGYDIQFLISPHMLLSWFICPHQVKWSTKQWDAGLSCNYGDRLFVTMLWKCFLRLTWVIVLCSYLMTISRHTITVVMTTWCMIWWYLKFNPTLTQSSKCRKVIVEIVNSSSSSSRH